MNWRAKVRAPMYEKDVQQKEKVNGFIPHSPVWMSLISRGPWTITDQYWILAWAAFKTVDWSKTKNEQNQSRLRSSSVCHKTLRLWKIGWLWPIKISSKYTVSLTNFCKTHCAVFRMEKRYCYSTVPWTCITVQFCRAVFEELWCMSEYWYQLPDEK